MKSKKMSRSANPKARQLLGAILILISVVLIGVHLFGDISYASWVEQEDGIKYLQEDGQYAVGFLDIEENRYYFDMDGHLVTGKFYVEEEDSYYYADEEGILQYGAIQTDDNFYITDDEGRLQKGFVEYEGRRYYFNEISELVVGWFKQDENWYYSDKHGVVMTGFVTIDGYRYYLGTDGTRVQDTILTIDGITYIFNKDGSVDENATLLYPVLAYLNQLRLNVGCSELILNSKVQACAILRAADLVNGFSDDDTDSLEVLLANRGVMSNGGCEFSYGGLEGYDINRLMMDMQKDVNLMRVISDSTISEVGLGVHTEGAISYYDIIFISNKNVTN